MDRISPTEASSSSVAICSVRFLILEQGSVEECRYYLILSKDLGYYDVTEEASLLGEVSKLLEAYTRSILNHSDS
ncbi:MAG: four helix bundle protein [Peptococcaceae bacterium]|nr:four helix bundle protein [Peptococcaceae bacterium]